MTTPSPYDWQIDQARIDRNWRAVVIELDAPRPGRVERLLRFFGLPAHVTRLMVATPALRRAWYLATGLAIFVGLVITDPARPRDGLLGLLLLAPLIPVLGVSMAYGVEADPAHEMGIATPLRGLRLILTRAAVVLAFSSFWVGVAALLTPEVSPMTFAWMLPSVGLTSATVALMTFIRPRVAASGVALTWLLGVLVARNAADDQLAAFTAAGQSVMVMLTAVALLVAMVRRDRFDLLEVR